jgi:hypothetical protein
MSILRMLVLKNRFGSPAKIIHLMTKMNTWAENEGGTETK